jgi:hypothetical protein
MTEDPEDGSITTSRDSYAQSECRVHCIMSNIMYIMYPHKKSCLTVFLFQENKSFGASCHLHSSTDVREVVSRTPPPNFTNVIIKLLQMTVGGLTGK